MQSYTDGRIKASITILARTDSDKLAAIVAEMTAPKAPKHTVKAAPKAATIAPPVTIAPDKAPAWHSKRPSKRRIAENRAMLRRINTMESMLNYKLSDFKVVNGGRTCKFNAGEYSACYYALKALTSSLEAEVAALDA